MDREEAMRLIAETYAREEMARNEAAWEDGKASLVLIKSTDDPPTFSFEFQNELNSLDSALSQADIDAESRVLTLDSAESFGGQLGEFVIPIAQFGIPALSVIIVAWMKAKSGRTAKVEFFADGRPKKLEASTTDEVVLLLETVNREAKKKTKKKS